MKFQCQETCGGKCCKIPKGNQLFVFLTSKDRMRLAAFLHKPINKFAQRGHFTTTRFGGTGWHWYLKSGEGQCKFLTKAGKCSVYEARPTQCKTWPFWPENMKPETQEMFMKECPGIGVGPELADEVLNAQLDEQRKADAVYTSQSR